ncbi:MAG: EF-hand domain-containing protein [Rubritepida sp.]|nr:EF-hand domain-containing protein [Rubritepida sp.]
MFRPLAILLTASLPVLAQPADAPRGRPDPTRMFNEFDANRDGRVTWDEGWAVVQVRFAAADANRDGALTTEEFTQLRPRREAPAGERAERMQRFAQGRFRAADANRDGKVTLDELRPMAEGMFRMMDANGDNAVTPDEVPRRGRQRPPG